MAARPQRETTLASCATSTGIPAKNAATILKPLVLKPFYIWCNMLLTGLHHSSPQIPPPLRAREFQVIKKRVLKHLELNNYDWS